MTRPVVADRSDFSHHLSELQAWRHRARFLQLLIRKTKNGGYIATKLGVKRGSWNPKTGGAITSHHSDLPSLCDPRVSASVRQAVRGMSL